MATVGFSDVTSANVVGYLNRDGREKCNFYTVCFDKVDGSDITIQDVQVSDDVEDMGADLQILDDTRACIGEAYQWVTADTAAGMEIGAKEGMGVWINEDFVIPEIDNLKPGEVLFRHRARPARSGRRHRRASSTALGEDSKRTTTRVGAGEYNTR